MKKLLIALLALASLSSEVSAFRFFGRNRACGPCPTQCPPQCPSPCAQACPPQCPQQVACPPRAVKACPPRVKCCRKPVRCCQRPRSVCPPACPQPCPAPAVSCPAPCPKPACCQYPYYQGRHCCRAVCSTACPTACPAPCANGEVYANGYQGGALSSTPEGLPVEGGAYQTNGQVQDQAQYYVEGAEADLSNGEIIEDEFAADIEAPAAVAKDIDSEFDENTL